jgi:hypothetical protein
MAERLVDRVSLAGRQRFRFGFRGIGREALAQLGALGFASQRLHHVRVRRLARRRREPREPSLESLGQLQARCGHGGHLR